MCGLPGVFRYLLIGHALILLVISIVVNVVFGLLTFSGADAVQTWTLDKGTVADSVGTRLFLPLITCLIASHTDCAA